MRRPILSDHEVLAGAQCAVRATRGRGRGLSPAGAVGAGPRSRLSTRGDARGGPGLGRAVPHARLQLHPQSGHAPARRTVSVCEWEDGRLAIDIAGRRCAGPNWPGRDPPSSAPGHGRRPRRLRRARPSRAPAPIIHGANASTNSARTRRSGKRWRSEPKGTFLTS